MSHLKQVHKVTSSLAEGLMGYCFYEDESNTEADDNTFLEIDTDLANDSEEDYPLDYVPEMYSEDSEDLKDFEDSDSVDDESDMDIEKMNNNALFQEITNTINSFADSPSPSVYNGYDFIKAVGWNNFVSQTNPFPSFESMAMLSFVVTQNIEKDLVYYEIDITTSEKCN
ncbi:hypothetical protein HPULCUR_001177 [Helicostylum pulchrum]|uniref:PiggyBac transposable element-derived protein domain-containing protein n=1 Tax=Helicostylum pulchrum TaxID=562976 RepID=A0ABP9XNM5_9FUNG